MKEEIKKQVRLWMFMLIVGFAILALLSWINDKPNTYVISDEQSPLIPKGVNAAQLQWNNITLTDSTSFDSAANTCTGSRYGMTISIYPCVTQALKDEKRVQFVNFSWNGAQARNLSWIFVYDGQLQSGSIEAYINASYSVDVGNYSNQFISNFLVPGIKNYTSMGSPTYLCNVGNLNNTQMYFVNLLNGSSLYYCFTNATIVNATSIRISGNADIGSMIHSTAYKPQWVDATDKIQYLGFGLLQDNRSYYKVEDVNFNVGDSIQTRWSFVPKDNVSKGKWHILGYDSGTGLINSINSNQYIYIDPWWSSSWAYKKAINITAITNTGARNYTIPINITWAGSGKMRTDFGDVRFTDPTESTTYPYWFYNDSVSVGNSTLAYVFIDTLQNETIYMYYGNPAATNSSDIVSSFMQADNFDGASLNTSKFATTGTSNAQSNGVLTITWSSGNGYVGMKGGLWNVNSMGFGIETTAYQIWSVDAINKYISFAYEPSSYVGTPFIQYADDVDASNDRCFESYNGARSEIARSTDMSTQYRALKMIFNATTAKAWLDGVNDPSGQLTSQLSPTTSMTPVLWLNSGAGSNFRVQWWYERPLANVEPTYAYGSEQTLGGSVSATPNYPADSFKANYSNVVISTNFSAVSMNMTNYTFYIYYSNGSLFAKVLNNTIYQNNSVSATYTTAFPDNSFQWAASVCGNDTTGFNACSFTVNRTFSVETVVPTVSISAPSGNVSTTSLPYNITLTATSSDANLNTCWYNTNENATNIIYTCNTTQTITFRNAGTYTITVYANDTYGNTGSSSVRNTIFYTFSPVTYSYFVVEGENNTILYNLTSFGSPLTVNNVSLFYNGTQYAMIAYNNTVGDIAPVCTSKCGGQVHIMGNGDSNTNYTYAFYREVTAPLVESNQNISFYITFNATESTGITGNFSQIVYNLANLTISSGVSCTTPAFTFNLADEENFTSLTGDFEYNFRYGLTNQTLQYTYGKLTNTNNFTVCFNSTISTHFIMGEGQIFYRSSGYASRRYYIFAGTNFSTTQSYNITLYDLSNTYATSFLITAQDNTLTPYQTKLLGLLRWYPQLNSYILVEMAQTDQVGTSIMRTHTEDIDYRVALWEPNGTLITLNDPTRFACLVQPCTYSFTVFPDNQDYTSITGIESALTYNTTSSSFHFVWNDPSSRTSTMNLSVYKVTGTYVLPVCESIGSGAIGVINCDVTGQTGMLQASVYRSASPATPFTTLLLDLQSDLSSVLGKFMLFMAAILAAAGFFIGIFNPVIGIIMEIGALIPSLFLGTIPLSVIIGFAIMGVVIVHFVKRVNQG